MHRLYRNGNPLLDRWQHLDQLSEIVPGARQSLPLDVWRESECRSDFELGLRLDARHTPAEIAPYLADVKLIVLQIDRFEDGRFLTQAHDLRQVFNYHRELRARGDLILDQIACMNRCGIDSFEFPQPVPGAAVQRALRTFSLRYQPDSSLGIDIRAARRNRAKQIGESQQ